VDVLVAERVVLAHRNPFVRLFLQRLQVACWACRGPTAWGLVGRAVGVGDAAEGPGGLLCVEDERILMQAWPVAVTDEPFHTLAAASSWETVEEGRYTEAAAEARALISTLSFCGRKVPLKAGASEHTDTLSVGFNRGGHRGGAGP
jgi:hypothetical protein